MDLSPNTSWEFSNEAIQNKFTRGSYLQTNEYPNAVTLCHDILFILFTLSILITN